MKFYAKPVNKQCQLMKSPTGTSGGAELIAGEWPVVGRGQSAANPSTPFGGVTCYSLIGLVAQQIDLSKNCLRAAFPALVAAAIVLKCTDDLWTGVDFPAQ
jgi:hypothetical protein